MLGLELYCNVLDGNAVEGAPTLMDKICKAKFLDRTFVEDIVLFAVTDGLPNNITSASITVPGEGPYGELSLNLGSKTVIQNLMLIPSAPVEDEDYQALSEIFCLPIGTVVKISVLGTDGYFDENSYTIENTQPSGQFVLSVPGAETGVEDVIKLIITLPDGGIIERTASLVFN